VKTICEDDTTKTQVEVGSSKSFLCIPDFLYFGAKLTYDTKGEPVPVTPWANTSMSDTFNLGEHISSTRNVTMHSFVSVWKIGYVVKG
jgi:hypothetical protein